MRMYQVGEYIVHPGQGVCRVEGVVESDMSVYMLHPLSDSHGMRISFPVESESRLRPVIPREQAQGLIDGYGDMDVEETDGGSVALEEEHFKHELRFGTCGDAVRVVKTFRRRIAEAQAANKKPPVVYQRLLKQASERSLQELSVALDLTEDEVLGMFERADDSAKAQ